MHNGILKKCSCDPEVHCPYLCNVVWRKYFRSEFALFGDPIFSFEQNTLLQMSGYITCLIFSTNMPLKQTLVLFNWNTMCSTNDPLSNSMVYWLPCLFNTQKISNASLGRTVHIYLDGDSQRGQHHDISNWRFGLRSFSPPVYFPTCQHSIRCDHFPENDVLRDLINKVSLKNLKRRY